MAFKAGAIYGEAILDSKKWDSGVNKLGKSNQSLTGSIFKAQIAVDVFKKAIGASIEFTKKAIQATIAYQEENSKFKTVFRDVGKSAFKMRDELINSFGLSRKASTELLASTGDLLTGFGFTQDMALSLSGEVQKLAVDLASFTNFQGGAKGASEALTKALLGERESVKSLGISVQEADVQAKILELTQKGITFETERQAKAYATLLIAQEQSKNAQGDFARTSDQLANRQRQLLSVQEDLSIQIGQIFTPILNEFAGAALKGAKGLRDFLDSAEGMNIISNIFAGIRASITVIIDVFEKLGNTLKSGVLDAFNDLKPSLDDLFDGVTDNISVFDIFAGIVEGVGVALAVAVKFVKAYVEWNIDLLRVVKDAVTAIIALGKALADPTKWKEAQAQLAKLTDTFKDVGENIVDNAKDIIETVSAEFSALPERTKETSDEMEQTWTNSFTRQKKLFTDAMQEQNSTITKGGADISKTNEETTKDILKKMQDFNNDFKKGWEEWGSGVTSVVSYTLGVVADTVSQISDIISSVYDNEINKLRAKNQEELAEIQAQREESLAELDTKLLNEEERLRQDYENGLINKEEYDMKANELEQKRRDQENAINEAFRTKEENSKKKALKKENEMEKKKFEANKATQIAQVWIEAATGIVAAWAGAIQALAWIPVAGPALAIAFGAVLTGLILGFAVAQTVVISQQQFVPKMARGGTASGPTMINERGGEILNLPDGTVVIPNDISRQIAANSGKGNNGTVINVSFAGAKIADDMSLQKISNYVMQDMAKQLRLS